VLDSQISVDLEAAYRIAGKRGAIYDRHANQEQQEKNGDDQ